MRRSAVFDVSPTFSGVGAVGEGCGEAAPVRPLPGEGTSLDPQDAGPDFLPGTVEAGYPAGDRFVRFHFLVRSDLHPTVDADLPVPAPVIQLDVGGVDTGHRVDRPSVVTPRGSTGACEEDVGES